MNHWTSQGQEGEGGCDVSKRITEADLRRWDTDEVYQSRTMARPPIILLVAEVRRLRGLIAAACDGEQVDGALGNLHSSEFRGGIPPGYCGCHDNPCYVELFEAEARAIREEQGAVRSLGTQASIAKS